MSTENIGDGSDNTNFVIQIQVGYFELKPPFESR